MIELGDPLQHPRSKVPNDPHSIWGGYGPSRTESGEGARPIRLVLKRLVRELDPPEELHSRNRPWAGST